jgi:isoquinoline 1-oxidoreductase beta subunit
MKLLTKHIACMEPLTCTHMCKENKVEVWGPIQGPDWIQRILVED